MQSLGAFLTGVLCAATLVVSAPAGAQALIYGAKGGLDLTRVHFGSSFAPDTGTSAGIVGGGFVTWKLADRLAVRVEILVAQERASFDGVITDTIRTLDVPVLVRYRVASLAGRAIHVSGGAVARRVFGATESAGGESSSIEDGISRTNEALVAGAGIGLTSHWTAAFRYLQGLKGIYKRIEPPLPAGTVRTDSTGLGTDGKSRTVQLTVEYQF